MNFQFLKDLFQACMMRNVEYLAIAVRNIYKGNRNFESVYRFIDTLYASNRLQLPLKGILIIGEAPGQVEDRKGLPWQGGTGRLLKRTLEKQGIDLFEDCICVNAVNCRPPKNRAPKAASCTILGCQFIQSLFPGMSICLAI